MFIPFIEFEQQPNYQDGLDGEQLLNHSEHCEISGKPKELSEITQEVKGTIRSVVTCKVTEPVYEAHWPRTTCARRNSA